VPSRSASAELLLSTVISVAGAVTNGVFGNPEQPNMQTARDLQALSLSVHIPLVCFGIAFPTIVLFVEALYLKTGNPVYKALAKRWSKVMMLLFAVGVVTGTILSFEFGLLWPNFTGTFGGVFGLGFTLEGISFFVEGIFIAIYVYGWDKLSPKRHLLAGIPVALAGVTGSLMVIAVNAWMNHPGGFTLGADGKVATADPWDALFGRGFVWHELVHMYLAGYLVCGFVVAGVYAAGWVRGQRTPYHRAALVIPLTIATLVAPVQVLVGDWAARTVTEDQPVKLAAMEGLGKTEKGAPFHVLGLYDEKTGEIKDGLGVPKLLSILAHHDPNATVQGLDSVPANERPSAVNVVRFAFQTMIAIGSALLGLTAWFVGSWWRKKRLPQSKWFYRAVVVAGPATIVALIAGWITTEVGRQPWIVYGYMRSTEAVTAAHGLPLALSILSLVYLALAIAVAWLLRRLAKKPPATELEPRKRRGGPGSASGPSGPSVGAEVHGTT
jgi:cytochrome d ubiquinol oxidase subunit I